MKTRSWLLLFLFGWVAALWSGALVGCDIMNTGPKVAQASVEGTTAVAKVLVTKLQPKDMVANAEGSIDNPEYQMDLFAGAGTLVQMKLRLIGARAGFNVGAGGQGMPAPDPEILGNLDKIWNTKDLPEERRLELITQALKEWFAERNVSVVPIPAKDEPVPPPTPEPAPTP